MSTMLRFVILLLVLAGSSRAFDAADLHIEPNIVYGYKLGLALTMDAYRPVDTNGAAVLFINSGGFRSPDFARQCVGPDGELWSTAATGWRFRTSAETEPALLQSVSFESLLEAGFTVFDVRHGSSPRFKLDEIVEDCRHALRFVRSQVTRFEIDPERLGVWGGSAGAYLAGYLAFSAEEPGDEVQALVLYYPTGYDLTEFPYLLENLPALNLSAETLVRLSLKSYIGGDEPPTLIVWGDLDKDFIVEPSQQIHVSLKEAGCDVQSIIIPGVGHVWRDQDGAYDPTRGDEALAQLVNWFTTHLTRTAAAGDKSNPDVH